MSKDSKLVLIDADVISHFIACSELLYIPKIFEPHKIVIFDTVYNEIARIYSRKLVLDNLLSSVKNISRQPFPINNIDIKK